MAAPLVVRGQWAVAALFFANGFLTGSWAPQIPTLLARHGLDESGLGLLIVSFGVGAVAAMTGCGILLSQFGSRAVVRVFSVVATLGLPLVVLAPNVPLAGVALLLFGGLIGGMDVAMNANAVVVERHMRRAIMSSSHGFWSLGGFAGGGLGGFGIEHFGREVHALMVGGMVLLVVVCAIRHLHADAPAEKPTGRSFSLPHHPRIYAVGVMALFSMVPEGAVLDWAALYLRQELGADLATASFAFGAFSAAMALMRFLGDRVRDNLGAVKTLRYSVLLAVGGMSMAGFAPSPWIAIASFAVAGVGIANVVPIVFSIAGNQPGISSGTGMSVVTTMGYSGILIAPSGIGFIAEGTGFASIFVALSGLLSIVLLLSPLAAAADRVQH